MELRDVKLTKGMGNEVVNELISKWITFEDEEYLGCSYKHNWKCKCGNVFTRRWNDIRRHSSIDCFDCIYNYNKKCKVCGKDVYCKDLCSKHYYQMANHGEVLDTSPKTTQEPNEIIKYNNYAEVIILNKRYEEKARVKIDFDDIDLIKEYKWTIDGNGYVSCNRKKEKTVLMHRLIINCPNDMMVDHINHDILDNRKENLRIVTRSQNLRNRDLGKNNKSGCNGVNWHKESQKWIARITVNKKVIYLGVYDNLDEAIRVRKEAEIKYFGEYQNKNVIKTKDRNNKYSNKKKSR
jgi:hypothetical protein